MTRKNGEIAQRMFESARQLGGEHLGSDGRGHQVFRFANGKTMSVPSSPSEFRGLKNAQLQMERVSGRKLPRRQSGRYSKRGFGSGFRMPAEEDRDVFAVLHAESIAAAHAEIEDVEQRLEALRGDQSRRAAAEARSYMARRLSCERYLHSKYQCHQPCPLESLEEEAS